MVYLLHVGSQLRVRWLVDLVVPINRHFNLLIELKDDQGILQVSTRQVFDTHQHYIYLNPTSCKTS